MNNINSNIKKNLFIILALIVIFFTVIIFFQFFNKDNINRKKLLNDIRNEVTVKEYGITNDDELESFIENNFDLLHMPHAMLDIINTIKEGNYKLYGDYTLKQLLISTKNISYDYLIKILATDNYDSSKYPLTEHYKNKFNNKSFIREVPVYKDKKLYVGIDNLEDKNITYHYYRFNPQEGYDEGFSNGTEYESRYKFVLDDNGYVDDILYDGTYITIDSDGEIPFDSDVKIKYISFQEDDAKDYIFNYCNKNKGMINLNKPYLNTSNLVYKLVGKKSILDDDLFKNLYIAKDIDQNEIIDLKESYCQVCAEYDDKKVYYDINWKVDNDYYVDDIDVTVNHIE